MKTTYKILDITKAYANQFVNLVAVVGDFGLATEVPEEVAAKTMIITEQDDRWLVEMFGLTGNALPAHEVCRHVFATAEQIAIDFLMINADTQNVKWLTENLFTESGINNPECDRRMRNDPVLAQLYLCLVRCSISPEQIAELRDPTFQSMVTALEEDTDEQKSVEGYVEYVLEMSRIMDFSAEQVTVIKALLPAA